MHHGDEKRSDLKKLKLRFRKKTTSVWRFNGVPDNLPPFHYERRIILPPSSLAGSGGAKLIRR